MKYKYIIAIGFICILLLSCIVLVMSTFFPLPLGPKQPQATPTPLENQVTPIQPLPSTPVATPTIGEDKNIERELDLLRNRQQLSPADAQAKATIIALQHPNEDVLYATNTYQVSYIRVLDEFQVEVDANDIQKTMADAVTWFMLQGMTHDGICKLPLTFYGSYTLRQLNKYVPPLAEGC